MTKLSGDEGGFMLSTKENLAINKDNGSLILYS